MAFAMLSRIACDCGRAVIGSGSAALGVALMVSNRETDNATTIERRARQAPLNMLHSRVALASVASHTAKRGERNYQLIYRSSLREG
jgi:hypothetical protein